MRKKWRYIVKKGYTPEPIINKLRGVEILLSQGETTALQAPVRLYKLSGLAGADVIMVGLPEPYAKRTAEGDIGLKYNLDRLLELCKDKETPSGINEMVLNLREESPFVPKTEEPVFYVDGKYILYAVGLLSQTEPKKALSLAGKYLKRI